MFLASSLRRASSSMRVGIAQSMRSIVAMNSNRIAASAMAAVTRVPQRAYALPAHGGKLLNLIDDSKQTVCDEFVCVCMV